MYLNIPKTHKIINLDFVEYIELYKSKEYNQYYIMVYFKRGSAKLLTTKDEQEALNFYNTLTDLLYTKGLSYNMVIKDDSNKIL